MSTVLELKQHDTAPTFRAQLLDDTTAVNLTTATAVKLLLKNPAGTLIVSDPLTVESGSNGWVNRPWGEDDLAVAGTYRAEVEVTWGDGTIQTFPRDGYAHILVTPDLG